MSAPTVRILDLFGWVERDSLHMTIALSAMEEHVVR